MAQLWKFLETFFLSWQYTGNWGFVKILTIFFVTILILATYWQLGFVTIMTFLLFDNFDLGNILAIGCLWQFWLFFCDNFDLGNILAIGCLWQFWLFFCDIFDLGNILAASLWQFFVWQFWSWQHTGSGLVTGTYGGYWTQCGNTMGSTPRTFLHWNNFEMFTWFHSFTFLYTFYIFLTCFACKHCKVLATDFSKQIHFRKKLLALLLFWATSISHKARPGKRCKKVLFTIKAFKSFVYNQSA